MSELCSRQHLSCSPRLRALNHLIQVARSLQVPQLTQLQDQLLIEPMLQHRHFMSQSSTLELKQHVPTSQVTKLRLCAPGSSGISGALVLGQPGKVCFLRSNSPGKHSKAWQSCKPPSMGRESGSPQALYPTEPRGRSQMELGVPQSHICYSNFSGRQPFHTDSVGGDSGWGCRLPSSPLHRPAPSQSGLHDCFLLNGLHDPSSRL